MTKKFDIKEAWLLDENGHKKMKLTPMDINTIPSGIKEEDINGGYGNVEDNKTK